MLTINFNPFPDLETDRLHLRRVNAGDVKEILMLRSNPETMQYIPRPLLKTDEEALEHIAMIDQKIEANEGLNWAITLKESPQLIGIIGHYRIKPEHYRAEIGYMLLPAYHNKGYVTEAVKATIQYGFEKLKLHSIEAIIAPENYASAKVLEKNGFVKEAHFKDYEFYDGKFIDSVVYSIVYNLSFN